MTIKREFTLGVDIDGVMGDYNSAFAKCWSQQSGIPLEDLPTPTSWNFSECGWGFRDDAHFLEAHRRAVDEQALFLRMKPMEGVSEALWELSDAGIHIAVLSHRILGKRLHRKVASDTLSWLDLHDLPYKTFLMCGAKAQMVHFLDAHIDDAPHNILDMRQASEDLGANTTVVVMDQPYNQGIDGPRVHNWTELRDLALQLQAQSGL